MCCVFWITINLALRNEKLSPVQIAERVKDADVIVFVGGTSAKLEGSTSFSQI
jgi:hypothetical protein